MAADVIRTHTRARAYKVLITNRDMLYNIRAAVLNNTRPSENCNTHSVHEYVTNYSCIPDARVFMSTRNVNLKKKYEERKKISA